MRTETGNKKENRAIAESSIVPRIAITPKEFGKRFGKSESWAYRQIYAGEIKVITKCRPMLIPVNEADRFTRKFLGSAARYQAKPIHNGKMAMAETAGVIH